MANGSAALQTLDSPSAFVCAPSGNADADPSELEKKIGQAVVAAVTALAMSIVDYTDRGGAMSPSSRTWCGTALGGLAQLRLDMLGAVPDFAEVAFAEGRRALQGHPTGVVLAHLGKGPVDAVIDELIGYTLVISSRVVDSELALGSN